MSSSFLLAQATPDAAPKPAETTGGETAAPAGKPAETATAPGEKTGTQTKTAAEGSPPETTDKKPSGGLFGGSFLLPVMMILVLMYFILFRPQRKQEKKRREMLGAMEKNNQVMTIGGIHGIIYSVGDTDVVLKIDERNDVRIRVSKSHIGRVVTDQEQMKQGG
ncbi:MAG: preprotein translocase subunit YajC [Anaerolineaceae bacterium]|nr:preprotein translocase subunit YajC [Anaerolineaceae bacterium]